MYEQITRVPMIVWSPGRVGAGKVDDALVQQMDIGRFLLRQAGASLDSPYEFQAVGALDDEGTPSAKGREFVFAEQSRDGILTDTRFMTMVRSRDYKLVHFLGDSTGQLFDLRADPGEVDNLWFDGAARGLRQDLLDTLRDWHIASQYDTRDWAKHHR